MSKLDNALRNLGRAHLLQDDTLRSRAMSEILHLAGVGSDTLEKSPSASDPFRLMVPRALPPYLSWGEHPEVDQVRRWGPSTRGKIGNEGAQLYYGKGYRQIARELAKEERCTWRPAEGRGGRSGIWLTDAEAATVRTMHAARYKGGQA